MEENIVKKVCKELGITQAELAEKLELPLSTIKNWTIGNVPKTAKSILNLVKENHQQKEIIDRIKDFKRFMRDL